MGQFRITKLHTCLQVFRGTKQKKLHLDSGMNKSFSGFIPLSLRAKYEFC